VAKSLLIVRWTVVACTGLVFAACGKDDPPTASSGGRDGSDGGAGAGRAGAAGRGATNAGRGGRGSGGSETAGEAGEPAAGPDAGRSSGGASPTGGTGPVGAGAGGGPHGTGGTSGEGGAAATGGSAGALVGDAGMAGDPGLEPDRCTPRTCQHGQRCRTVDGAAVCDCEYGYSGVDCGAGHSTCAHGGCDFTQVSISRDRGCALRSSGEVYCWRNGHIVTNYPRSSAISVGRGVLCGIHSDTGFVWCRGSSDEYNPPGLWATTPTQAISAGRYHVCAVQEGSTRCWQIANPPESGLTDVPENSAFVKIEASEEGTCGLRADGSLSCWGSGGTRVGPYIDFATDDSSCAVKSDGELECYGCGNVPAPPGPFKAVTTGFHACCGIRGDDTLACWGSAGLPPPGTFTRVSGAESTFCAVATDGTIACWGADEGGVRLPRIGPYMTGVRGGRGYCYIRPSGTLDCFDGTTTGGLVYPPWGRFTEVAVGYQTACALTTDGAAECFSMTGDLPAVPPVATFSTLVGWGGSSSGERFCGLTVAGEVLCWGGSDVALPDAPVGPFQRISLAASFMCALRMEGTLTCWGSVPAAVPSVSGPFGRIATGPNNVCGLTTQGEFDCGNPSWNAGAGPGPFDDLCLGGADSLSLAQGSLWFARNMSWSATVSNATCASSGLATTDAGGNVTFR
jgi:hypothetical protein